MRVFVCGLILALAASGLACRRAEAPGATAAPPPTIATLNALAARVDPLTDKTRVVVMTDIANEPDDQMSMVRFLVYANEFDVEGLIATTSTWMRNKVRPDVIRHVIDVYAQVQSSLASHAPGFPTAEALRAVVAEGQPTYGMAGVGQDRMSPGAVRIIAAADKADGRPLWVLGWGGTNTLAQALRHVRETRTPEQLAAFVARLRVYTISDQDDAGPWIRREFPALFYVAHPSPRMAMSTIGPPGPASAVIASTRTAMARTSRRSPMRGWTHTSEARGRSARSTSIRAASTKATRRRFSADQQRPGERQQPVVRRVGRPLRVAPAIRRISAVWTQGGDAFPAATARATQSSASMIGPTLGSSDDLALAARVPIRFRRAHGLDGEGSRVGQSQPPGRRERRPGRAPVTLAAKVGTPLRLDAAGTSDPEGMPSRTDGRSMPRPALACLSIRYPPARPCRSGAAAIAMRAAFLLPRPAARLNRRRVSSFETRDDAGDGDSADAGHRARDPRSRGRRIAASDVVPARDPEHRGASPVVALHAGRAVRVPGTAPRPVATLRIDAWSWPLVALMLLAACGSPDRNPRRMRRLRQKAHLRSC